MTFVLSITHVTTIAANLHMKFQIISADFMENYRGKEPHRAIDYQPKLCRQINTNSQIISYIKMK